MTISQMGESAIIEYAVATTMPETAEACFIVTVMCPFGILGGVPLEAICDAYPILVGGRCGAALSE